MMRPGQLIVTTPFLTSVDVTILSGEIFYSSDCRSIGEPAPSAQRGGRDTAASSRGRLLPRQRPRTPQQQIEEPFGGHDPDRDEYRDQRPGGTAQRGHRAGEHEELLGWDEEPEGRPLHHKVTEHQVVHGERGRGQSPAHGLKDFQSAYIFPITEVRIILLAAIRLICM